MLNYTRGDTLLEINKQFYKGILFIRLSGMLDKNTIDEFKENTSKLIKDNGIKNIVFNISNLSSIDCYGINALLYNYELCRNNKGNTLICGLKDNIVKKRIENSRLLNYMFETSNELSAINVINL